MKKVKFPVQLWTISQSISDGAVLLSVSQVPSRQMSKVDHGPLGIHGWTDRNMCRYRHLANLTDIERMEI